MRDIELAGYDPFSGDKDSGGWERERREVVKTLYPGRCMFDEPHEIVPGTRAVRYSAVQHGTGWRSFLICAECIEKWDKT